MWTNSVLRRHLGERGFNEIKKDEDKHGTVSIWMRHGEQLTLVEYKDETEPALYFKGKAIDPHEVGWMNVNVQEQGYREESAERARTRDT